MNGVMNVMIQFYIFETSTGKLRQILNESEELYKEKMMNEELLFDAAVFNKKLKMEDSIRKQIIDENQPCSINCVFDQTDTFILYPCLVGIKIVNVVQSLSIH